MKTSELLSHGFPKSLSDIWLSQNFKELLPVQVSAVKEFALFNSSSSNLLVVAPTSSGKTFIGELAALREYLEMRRSLFLVPFRAIAEELYADFKAKYGDYGLRIAISDRDHREYDEDILNGEFDIAIVVYEKLVGLIVAEPQLLSGCKLLIADEVQMIMDVDRGPTIELLLTKILLEENPVRIVGLSAVLDKLNGFDEWLRARVLTEKQRPIELREAIYSSNGSVNYREFNSKNRGKYELPDWNNKEEGLINLVQSIVDKNEQVLVFCSTRNSTVSNAHMIADHIKIPNPATKTIMQLNELPDSAEREEIQDLLNASVAYHNSDLTLEERLVVESGVEARADLPLIPALFPAQFPAI